MFLFTISYLPADYFLLLQRFSRCDFSISMLITYKEFRTETFYLIYADIFFSLHRPLVQGDCKLHSVWKLRYDIVNSDIQN